MWSRSRTIRAELFIGFRASCEPKQKGENTRPRMYFILWGKHTENEVKNYQVLSLLGNSFNNWNLVCVKSGSQASEADRKWLPPSQDSSQNHAHYFPGEDELAGHPAVSTTTKVTVSKCNRSTQKFLGPGGPLLGALWKGPRVRGQCPAVASCFGQPQCPSKERTVPEEQIDRGVSQ